MLSVYTSYSSQTVPCFCNMLRFSHFLDTFYGAVQLICYVQRDMISFHSSLPPLDYSILEKDI